jgi:hypothetical protein
MNPAVAIFAGLLTVCAFLPVVTSTFLGYRAGEGMAVSIGAISGLVLLMSCGLWAYLPHISQQLSEGDKHVALFVVFMTGVPALCTFVGIVAGYVAMGLFSSEHEGD